MKTELRAYIDDQIRTVDLSTVALQGCENPDKIGLFVRDEDGVQWLVTEHRTYKHALEAQEEFHGNFTELVLELAELILGTGDPKNITRAMRYHQTVGAREERFSRILDLAEAFTWKHLGFQWGTDDMIRYMDRHELPPFGADYKTALLKCAEAFELSGFCVPLLLRD